MLKHRNVFSSITPIRPPCKGCETCLDCPSRQWWQVWHLMIKSKHGLALSVLFSAWLESRSQGWFYAIRLDHVTPTLRAVSLLVLVINWPPLIYSLVHVLKICNIQDTRMLTMVGRKCRQQLTTRGRQTEAERKINDDKIRRKAINADIEHQQSSMDTQKRGTSILIAERFIHKANWLPLSSRWQPANSYYCCKKLRNDPSREPSDPHWGQWTRRVCSCFCDLAAGWEPREWTWEECEQTLKGPSVAWADRYSAGPGQPSLGITSYHSNNPHICPELYSLQSI